MKRFFGLWLVLSPIYLLAAALSSWLVLHRLDLTYAAYASWLVVPTVQALALTLVRTAIERGAPVSKPRASSPKSPIVVAVAGCFIAAFGVLAPLNPVLGFRSVTSRQALLTHLVIGLSGLAFTACALRLRATRPRILPFSTLLLAFAIDAPLPWLNALPGNLLPGRGTLVPEVIVYGALTFALYAAALRTLGAIRPLDATASRLLSGSLALGFLILHVVLLNHFQHPWLARPWDALVPAGFSLAAWLGLASGLATFLMTAKNEKVA